MLTSPQYPNGYYPSCSDLVEVTAQVTTPLPAAALIEPLDPFADENMCGPFVIRFNLDPRPFVKNNSTVITPVNQEPFTATVNLQTDVSSMMGNIDAATFRWEREIWRYTRAGGYVAPVTGTPDAWRTITLTNRTAPNGITRDGGTFIESGLGFRDSIRIRCVMDLSAIPATNTVLDKTCTTMASGAIYVTMPRDPNERLLALASKQESGSSTMSAAPNSAAQVHTRQQSQTVFPVHTVNLLTAPNPATTSIGISFTLPQDATVNIEVIDALQRKILSPLADQLLSQGGQTIIVPVASLPSGAYSVRIIAHLVNGATLMERRTLVIVR
jgi:hypothetical protein